MNQRGNEECLYLKRYGKSSDTHQLLDKENGTYGAVFFAMFRS
jgi:hypothetical protein